MLEMQASARKALRSSQGPWSACDFQMQISGPPRSLQLSGPMDTYDSQRRACAHREGERDFQAHGGSVTLFSYLNSQLQELKEGLVFVVFFFRKTSYFENLRKSVPCNNL